MEKPASAKGSNRISRRVLALWEQLVGEALRAQEARESLEIGSSRRRDYGSSSYTVPQFLQDQTNIESILQAARDIELENIQVAQILYEYAFTLVHQLDPMSEGRDVLQLKTGLSSMISKKRMQREGQKLDRTVDIQVISDYYKKYRERLDIANLEEEERKRQQESTSSGGVPELQEWRSERLRRAYEIANILQAVIESLLSDADPVEVAKLDLASQGKVILEEDAKKIRKRRAYNILPMEEDGVSNPFSYFPEVTGATKALLYTEGSPRFPYDYVMPENRNLDVFDFLHYVFCFQKDNVANQREHLILLLASSQSRKGVLHDGQRTEGSAVNEAAVDDVYERVLGNYMRWCDFLLKEPKAKKAKDATRQEKIYLIALHLLIWGEAANLRFMPECLCYIFHHMAHDMFELLRKEEVEWSSQTAKPSEDGSRELCFLEQVITPVYQIVAAEAHNNGNGVASHSAWRNYDDFNEFFWQADCFDHLSWPWKEDAAFFMKPKKRSYDDNDKTRGHQVGKINFVEHRTGFHLYHSFYRLWIFFICMLQGLTIWAFCNQNFHVRTIKKILSVAPTFAILTFFQSVLDVLLMWGAYRSTRHHIVMRMLIRLVWFGAVSGGVIFLYVKTLLEDRQGTGSTVWFRIFYLVLGSYAILHLLIGMLSHIPWLRIRTAEWSKYRVIRFIKAVHQERYFVGRGMYERLWDYFRYVLFWVFVLFCKFSFSYHFQLLPMVVPTRLIVELNNINYVWHDFVSKNNHNALTLLALWAPVVMIYFLDVQVWYIVTSALLGGLEGAKDRLGEIRDLSMLRKRFIDYPQALVQRLQPMNSSRLVHQTPLLAIKSKKNAINAIKFAPIWNEVIKSLREEDLINNKEKELLIMPEQDVMQQNSWRIHWPLFLVANKVHVAVELAAGNKKNLENLWEKVNRVEYMANAVEEAFETLQPVLENLLNADGAQWVRSLFGDIIFAIGNQGFVANFNLTNLREMLKMTRKITKQLWRNKTAERVSKVEAALQRLQAVVMNGFLPQDIREGFERWDRCERPLFTNLNWPDRNGQKDAKRLFNLLTVQKINASKTLDTETIPRNLEARRRLQFFTNSLFMHMPEAPTIRKMFSFCVFTPYYAEDVMYDLKKLCEENKDGISILFYLQKIYPDEWQNFLERIGLTGRTVDTKVDEKNEEVILQLRLWASYRGQTLARTVRGMMYYKRALELQAAQEGASTAGWTSYVEEGLQLSGGLLEQSAKYQAELKFTYVVTCQIFGQQKKEGAVQAADILYLMHKYDSLRIAYIDVVETTKDKKVTKSYYSKLVKADPYGQDQEIYSIKLPGEVKLGEGKPENQNHAIIFTRGDAIQTIDMNQDNYLEEALKVRNLLAEFDHEDISLRPPTILGVREHVFTGSVSSLAWFMSMQESSFVTLGQRVLARPLKVRMHYGHPDVFDRIFHISRGGISKASRVINLSEDIFAGFNSTLRQGNVTHHEYIQVGKGRDVGLNQIALFEAKVASGNGEQSLSRDVYRLGQLFDFFRMLSFFYTSVGFYVTTMMTVLTLYVFLYGKAYLALSGVDASLQADNNIIQNAALQSALNTQFLVQIGIFTAVPMIMNLILEQGILRAIISFCTMQLQMASVFFTFSLGTRTHYFGRTILHGGAKYRSTGRGFVVTHIKFAENYRMYSRSHFTKAMEIIMLLIVYLAYGAEDRKAVNFILLTFSSWFLALSWLFAPYIFNPSGFEWQKTVEDFEDWTKWLYYKGGVGVKIENSWEAWWFDEQTHIRTNTSRFWEIILSLRFFIFQYGIVYHLHVDEHSTRLNVYGFSWLVLIVIVVIFKLFTFTRKSPKVQRLVRLFQTLLFMSIVTGIIVAVVLTPLTIGDVFAVGLALIPTGWGLLSVAIACRPAVKGLRLWESVQEIARAYDACMGMLVFIPIAFLSWFPFVSTFQTRLVFNQAFSRGLEISLILAGNRPNSSV
ncbi:unnamed protein product [Sphagnum compactum]